MTKKVRVELPVLLYVDVEVAPLAEGETLEQVAKDAIWGWLGEPGQEQGAAIEAPSTRGLSDAKIYPSDHEWCNSGGNFEICDEHWNTPIQLRLVSLGRGITRAYTEGGYADFAAEVQGTGWTVSVQQTNINDQKRLKAVIAAFMKLEGMTGDPQRGHNIWDGKAIGGGTFERGE